MTDKSLEDPIITFNRGNLEEIKLLVHTEDCVILYLNFSVKHTSFNACYGGPESDPNLRTFVFGGGTILTIRMDGINEFVDFTQCDSYEGWMCLVRRSALTNGKVIGTRKRFR